MLNEGIIATSTIKSKYSYTKAEKIIQYRKKHNAIRHEYFTMAQKYMGYTKVLLTFTVPTEVQDRTIKNGRYTKLRKLIKIRAYIAKLLNNSSDTKYFMNIELGKAYSNPHLHLQLWIKDDISNTSSITTNIHQKTITKFNLNKSRCHVTEATHAVPIYDYVIKDYAKDLSDKDLWDLETQKKRFRKVMGSSVRFYSKSKDKYCKSIYRKLYYSLGVVRNKANDFLDFFIKNFYTFTKRNLPKISTLCYVVSYLGYIEQERIVFVLYICLFIFVVLFCCLDPPGVYLYIYLLSWVYVLVLFESLFYFKGDVMCLLFFSFVWVFVFIVEVWIRSPCFMNC